LLLGELENRGGIDSELIDLAGLDLPAMRQRLGDTENPPLGAIALSEKLTRADGLLIVAPEYKNSFPGSLKNALDYLAAGILKRKALGIVTVSSGGFGGLNCLAQLRLVCLAMGGVPIPAVLPVSRVEETFDQEGGLCDPKLAARVGPFLDELIWYTKALTRERRTDATSGLRHEGRY
jgi:NAD(P)H-dependent FMN reductase